MDKNKIRRALLDQLIKTRETLVNSALEAREAATNEESKAENKYDTRGLEASYLAGAQALRAAELMQSIAQLEQLKIRSFSEGETVQVGALVRVELDGEEDRTLFLLPTAGGSKAEVDGVEVLIITPVSPLGRSLLGKRAGDDFELKTSSKSSIYEIIEVS